MKQILFLISMLITLGVFAWTASKIKSYFNLLKPAFPIKDIRPSFLAKFLVKFVHKSPYGIGLGSPWTMELAIKEGGGIENNHGCVSRCYY